MVAFPIAAPDIDMTTRWYFDFISPFAYLQWQRIRTLSQTLPFDFRPLLFAGLLQHHAHKGPAEIPGKREFTYRFVLWRAAQDGIALRFPPAHPFNPLAALRLCVAAGGTASAIDAIFRHIWRDGRPADSIASLREVAGALGIDDAEAAVSDPQVKATLRTNFDAALADGVFGVPSIVAHGEVFWGNDATAMYEQYLADPAMFDSQEMRALRHLPVAVQRV
jgi:2-hydroxychromene-2-carboxylate isomerase